MNDRGVEALIAQIGVGSLRRDACNYLHGATIYQRHGLLSQERKSRSKRHLWTARMKPLHRSSSSSDAGKGTESLAVHGDTEMLAFTSAPRLSLAASMR